MSSGTTGRLTDIEISVKLRSGKAFEVLTKRERQRVLDVARLLGIGVKTNETDFGFSVKFIAEQAINRRIYE